MPDRSGRPAVRERGGRPVHLQPGRGLRRRHRRSTAASADIGAVLAERAGLDVADARPAPLRALRRRRGRGTPSGSPPASTRWSSARRRSSASSATRTPGHRARHRRPAAARADAAGAAGRQAGARRDRHRPGRAERGQRRARPLAAATAVAGRSALVIGAGSMGGARPGHAAPRPAPARCSVTNRGADRAPAAGRAARRRPRSPFAELAEPLSHRGHRGVRHRVARAGPHLRLVSAALADRRRSTAGPARPRRAARRRAGGRRPCPASTLIDMDRLGAASLRRAVRSADRGRGRRDRRGRGRGLPGLAARRRRGADRGRPAGPGRRGGRRRAAPARPAAPRSHRRPAGRRGARRAPGRAAAAALSRPSGCASSPPNPAATSTRRCCASCSTWPCRDARRRRLTRRRRADGRPTGAADGERMTPAPRHPGQRAGDGAVAARSPTR